MIAVSYRDGFVLWAPDGVLVLADPREVVRVERLFGRPAIVRRSTTGDDGLIAEEFVTVPPGSAEHARGVLWTLPDVALIGDTLDT